MRLTTALAVGVLAAGLAACKQTVPLPPAPKAAACNCLPAQPVQPITKAEAEGKGPPPIAAPSPKAASPAAVAQAVTASRPAVARHGSRRHAARPAYRYASGRPHGRRYAEPARPYRYARVHTGEDRYGRDQAHGRQYRYEREYSDNRPYEDGRPYGPPPSAPPPVYGREVAHGYGPAYSYSAHSSGQSGYASAAPAYVPVQPASSWNASQPSSPRAYTVSRSARGDAALSRSERRIRCPW